LFFMMICAVSSTLLFYASSVYGQGIDQQISAIYNLEYTGNALVALQSADNYVFWNGLRRKVAEGNPDEVKDHIAEVWDVVNGSSPSPATFLCFQGCGTEICYPEGEEEYFLGGYVTYTSSVNIEPGCQAILKVYY